MSHESVLYKLHPAVPNHWLLLLAGFVWMGVGAFLCVRAVGWLEALHDSSAIWYFVAGIAVAVVWSRLMFTNVARKNVGRIFALPERACVFAFVAWRGYAMIGGMIVLGSILRNSSLPKEYLSAAYIAMGGTLFLSSIEFFRHFWRHRRRI